jgi:pimeloyl-ACP methyl ester carboxylesterase
MRLSCLILLAALPLAACTPPAWRLEPTTFIADDGTKVAAELGKLRVPENRSKPDSRQITISFIRFKSTAARPGAPIVYLAGGPGGSGIEAARGSRLPLFLALRAYGDVIALDQRGTSRGSGDDPETDCDERFVIDPTLPLDRQSAGTVIADATRRCAERLTDAGFDLTGYTTPESAADLDDLRRALGVDKLTLWGISYGTHLALATIKAYGPHVDRAILAGVEGLDDTAKLPSDQQEVLALLAALARPQTPDLLATIEALLHELAAQPRVVSLTHPVTGESAPFVLGPLDLQVVIAQMLTGPESSAGLPDLVHRLTEGDWTALALLSARQRFGEAPIAMATAMDCASGASAARRARIADEAKHTLLGDAINLPFPEICAGIQVADLGDDFRAPVESDIPVLLISGTLDGRTRPRQAEALRAGLPNAHQLVIDGAGHSDPLLLSSPEILATMQQFLRGDAISDRTITLPAVELLPLRTVAAVPDEVLASYVGDYRVGTDSVRRVIKAGSILYTVRDRGLPLPIRSASETEFFYEGSAAALRFEVDSSGKFTAMRFRSADGQEERCPRM